MRRALVLVSVTFLGLVGSIVTNAGASDAPAAVGGWVQCSDAGTLHFSPGATLTPQPIRISFTLDLSGCTSSDSSIHGGTVTAVADGPNFSCASGQITNGAATFFWDNGRTSDLAWGGAGLVANGTIIGGSEFVGEPFGGYVVPKRGDLLACQTPGGQTQLDVTGFDELGVPEASGNAHVADPSRSPEQGGWAVCRIEEDAVFTPGVTNSAQFSRFTTSAYLTECQSSDPTMQAGVMTVSGSGTFSCVTSANTDAIANEVIRWNNGRWTSFVEPVAINVSAVAVFAGSVTGGTELVGDSVRNVGAFTGADPRQCAEPTGLTHVHLTNVGVFT